MLSVSSLDHGLPYDSLEVPLLEFLSLILRQHEDRLLINLFISLALPFNILHGTSDLPETK